MFTDLPTLHRFETFPPASNRGYWGKIAALERNAGLIAELKKVAAAAKVKPVPQLSAVDYMKFQRNGNRLDYELPYFARRYNLEALVVTETLEHRGEYLDAIAEYLWQIDSELTWVLPAHARLDTPAQFARPGETLPPRELNVVDLFAAETAAFLATTLTLLGEEIAAAVSRNLVNTTIELIDLRVLRNTEANLDRWGWRRGRNNWTPWCASDLLWVASAIMTDDLRFTAFARRLQTVTDRYFERYPEDGGCDEGPGYWNLSPVRYALYAEGIYRASDGAVDLFAGDKFRNMADYAGYAWYAKNRAATFADCGGRHQVYTGMIRRMARRSGASRSLRMTRDYEAQNGLHAFGHTGLLMTLFELAEPVCTPAEAAAVPHDYLHVYPLTEQLHVRCGDFFVAMKGGCNGESHNHNDVGQFVFGSNGKMVVADIGTGEYTKATFGPKRYENWVQSGIGHNPPVFDGAAQAPGREFHSGGFTVEGTPENFTAVCDLTPAYPAELGLKSCVRKLRFDGERLTVTDSFTAEKPLEMTVRLFHECPGVEIAGEGFETSRSELPLADSWLRAAWGEKLYETRLAAPRAAAGEITYTVEARD